MRENEKVKRKVKSLNIERKLKIEEEECRIF